MTETTDRSAAGVLWVLSLLALIVLGIRDGFVTGSVVDPLPFVLMWERATESFWYAVALGVYVLTSLYWLIWFMAFGPRFR